MPTTIVPSARDPYDVNFCYPVRELESDRVRLTPFVPKVHSPLMVKLAAEHLSVMTHLVRDSYGSLEEFNANTVDLRMHADPKVILFAVYDLTRLPPVDSSSQEPASTSSYPPSSCFAGIFGYTRTYPENLVTEIGPAFIFPPFQRTHVAAHTMGMLLDYCLSSPTSLGPALFKHTPENGERGLGLRRAAYCTSTQNVASLRAAERMGFKHEGVRRWWFVLPSTRKDQEGTGPPRPGGPKDNSPGQDVVMMAVCWDDWENGGREHARTVMERR